MTRRTLIALSALVAVVGVAFVLVVGNAILSAPEEPPRVSAFADGRYEEVEPFRYCPVQEPLCDYEGTTASLPVREGYPLQLSLPGAISENPWGFASVYADEATGTVVEADEYYAPGSRNTLTVPAVNDDGLTLIGVEIRLPSGVIDVDTDQEEIVSHAIWSIATTPELDS
ncbi:hypothetical protein ASG56_04340 [Rhodococcus sp. Leaf7]|uniref:DUF2771 domain-containing protein n=1 Tax=unclassified Rhodococcus (in: high G+C Gram-positive bacteria) TaxID=192944 RepID=UPI0006FB6BC7|nr:MULTISPECIES: DUF2771 domain-containing protein [unclassified Rhodococcus (in: high G+C Gram-positive bacteria)]KQU06835.1 hypothetical protein ASG56_04340 [Rhodococcus sp. Leaf7]KQU42354.1 hypothetical protein ASG64_04340 [Rhodococcus sp. Leaf247]